MSNTTTKAHFARMTGMTQPAIGKACKHGNVKTIVVGGKTLINLDHRITKAYLTSKMDSPKPPKVEKKKKAAKVKEVAPEVEPEEPKEKKPDKFGRVTSLDDITPENLIDVEAQDIKKFKDYEAALKTRLEIQTRRGDLIPRIMVRQAFSKLYQIYVNQFKTSEDRLVPDICSIFKFPDSSPEAVELRELLSADMAKGLNHSHRTFNDFLRKVKAEKI